MIKKEFRAKGREEEETIVNLATSVFIILSKQFFEVASHVAQSVLYIF